MPKTETSAEAYNRGFNDGLQWVADCLRNSADAVERTVYADFERKSGNGGTFRGITKTGQTHFASQLRSVAQEIESAIQKATDHGPKT